MPLFYKDYCYILPFLITFIFLWIFFIKVNFFNVRLKPLSTEILKNSEVIKKTHYSVFIKWIFVQFFILNISIFYVKGYTSTFLWNNFYINNFNLYIIQLAFILLSFLLIISNTLTYNNVNYNIDFFFSLSNSILFLVFILMTNNLFSFIFLLELNSIIIFYKFVCSKYWYKNNSSIEEKNFDIDSRLIPKNYLNMLFFQYWSTFFSSILIFFSISNIFLLYGSTDYVLLEGVNLINSQNNFIKLKFISLIWVPMFLGLLMKIGLTPFHLFKIEVYRGLPLISLIFYTTLYFFVYFIYFVLLLNYHLDFLKLCLNSIFYLIIILGTIYIITLIFDITSLKSFFAYSTIINSMLFFIASFVF